jgi:replication-associated recombination protein RarA
MVFEEAHNEYLIDGLAEALAKAETPAPPIPLAVDRYVAMSALQKAIRRGDEELALRAAMTLRIEGPHAIWRRLGIIAFEDIGVGNIDVVGWATVVIGDRELRTRLGGEWKVMDFVIRTLCR